jgi:hypothetical protein
MGFGKIFWERVLRLVRTELASRYDLLRLHRNLSKTFIGNVHEARR